MADIRFRRIVATLGVVAFVATSASSALAGATPAQKCAASRQKAAGKKIKAKMGCQSKAKAKNTAVDPACLTKAEAKFSSAFAKTSGCPGTASGIESLVDSCVATLTGDAPGNGKCPSSTAKAEGKAGSCELGCTAKEITKPGSLAGCHAKCDGKLSSGIAKAGPCGQSPTIQADVHNCRDSISAALQPTTTTTSSTSTTTTTSSSTSTSSSSSTSTSTSSSTTTSTAPLTTSCCQLAGACFDAKSSDAAIKCPLAGGTIASPGSACGAFTGTCGPTKQTGTMCCQIPTGPPYPHASLCFDSNAPASACTSQNLGFGPGVVFSGSSACGAFTETCGGSPSGAFLF